MSPSAPSSTTTHLHSIITVTESPGTTTIFITTLLPATTPAPPSTVGGGSGPSKQKAVIAGSAVGGFVGFSFILGLLLWFSYFRGAKGKQSGGDDQPTTYLAGRRAHEEKSIATPSLSTSEPHTSAPTSHPDGRDKVVHERDQDPVQFPSSVQPPEAAVSSTHPTRRRTITSDSENGTHIPVVVPSFAYRESTASASSGSRIVNVLKRTSAAGATVSSSSSRRRMSDAPYQYGVVGSADSRLGGLLSLEPGSSRLGSIHHDATELEDRRAEALYGPASSPTRVSVPLPIPRSSRAHEHSPMHGPHPSVSAASGGGHISGSGSMSGHSADSCHTPILAAAACPSYHELDQPLHAIPRVAPSTPLSYSGRPQRPSSPLDEHIILSNYISPPSVSSSSSLGGKKSSWKVRGKRPSTTVSDSGTVEPGASPNVGTSSAPDAWNMQRSLSLDMAFIRNTTSRTKRDDVSPHPPLSAGPSPSTPARQISPPSSFPHAQLSSIPSAADPLPSSSVPPISASAPVSAADENDSEYSSSASAEARRRKRSRSRSRRRRTLSGETPGEMVNPHPSSFVASRQPSDSYGHAFGHSRPPHSHEYSMFGSAEYEPQDEELVRLARTARRAERSIRRESRRQSDPGHGDESQQQDPSHQHRSRHRKSRQRAGSRTRKSPSSADGAPSTQRPQLVLRNV